MTVCQSGRQRAEEPNGGAIHSVAPGQTDPLLIRTPAFGPTSKAVFSSTDVSALIGDGVLRVTPPAAHAIRPDDPEEAQEERRSAEAAAKGPFPEASGEGKQHHCEDTRVSSTTARSQNQNHSTCQNTPLRRERGVLAVCEAQGRRLSAHDAPLGQVACLRSPRRR